MVRGRVAAPPRPPRGYSVEVCSNNAGARLGAPTLSTARVPPVHDDAQKNLSARSSRRCLPFSPASRAADSKSSRHSSRRSSSWSLKRQSPTAARQWTRSAGGTASKRASRSATKSMRSAAPRRRACAVPPNRTRPRNIHVVAAAALRPVHEIRRSRGGAATRPRNIHVVAAAAPRQAPSSRPLHAGTAPSRRPRSVRRSGAGSAGDARRNSTR